MASRDGAVRMSENLRSDFGVNSQVEQSGRESASPALPAVPAVSDLRNDGPTRKIVEIQSEVFFLTCENPAVRSVAPLVRVEHFTQRPDDRNSGFALWRFRHAFERPPHRAANNQFRAIVVFPTQTANLAQPKASERRDRDYSTRRLV